MAETYRASVHFRKPDGPSKGWAVGLAHIPRIGEEVRLIDGGGEDVARGIVTEVRHFLFTGPGLSEDAGQMVEVICG